MHQGQIEFVGWMLVAQNAVNGLQGDALVDGNWVIFITDGCPGKENFSENSNMK